MFKNEFFSVKKQEFALFFPKQRNKADPKEYSIMVHMFF